MKSIMRMSMMVEVRVIVVIVIVMMALLSDGVAVAGSFSPKPHHCCPKRVASSQLPQLSLRHLALMSRSGRVTDESLNGLFDKAWF